MIRQRNNHCKDQSLMNYTVVTFTVATMSDSILTPLQHSLPTRALPHSTWPAMIGPNLSRLWNPPQIPPSLTQEKRLESRRNQVFITQELPLKGTQHTWSLHLACLSLLAFGMPTATARSSKCPLRGGRDTAPIYLFIYLFIVLFFFLLFYIVYVYC